ncbi:MAG TPA: hypothetical protein VMW35_07180 [Myxococcota bacterium]|jgi:ABC-type phosphate transport system substrate-binding protein|nr:hypothetical protein [Myxococcota bacterium]
MRIHLVRSFVVATAATLLGGAALCPGAANAQELRTGGSSAAFTTQNFAAMASFSSITRVERLCSTGGAEPAGTCAGAAAIGGKGKLEDYVIIEGTLKNCGTNCAASTTDPSKLGRNGGGFARVYISSNGSGRGLSCGSTQPTKIGFLSRFGFNGVAGGGDDPGSDGNGAIGVPAGWPAAAATPPINLGTLNRPALVQCDTTLKANIYDKLPAAVKATVAWNVTAATELCVVDIDADGDGVIDGRDDGASLPRTQIAGGGNESSNLNQSCDLGFGDLPPSDFENPAISSLTLNGGVTTGLQVFKIVVNRNVRAKSDSTKKVMLQDPQLEGIFGLATFGNACSWSDVGGQVIGDTDGKFTVCYRESGSGTRETYRNTFMLDARGQQDQGTTPGTFDCENFDQNGGGTTTITQKRYIENPTSGDEATCVSASGFATGTNGNIGYVNANRTNANFYAVPVFGVDPDAQGAVALRNLVKCGAYPYTGPLSAGKGPGGDPLGLRQMQLNAVSSEVVFDDSTGADYIPFGPFDNGVAFQKDVTAGQYFVKFKPASCPGVIPQPPLAP